MRLADLGTLLFGGSLWTLFWWIALCLAKRRIEALYGTYEEQRLRRHLAIAELLSQIRGRHAGRP